MGDRRETRAIAGVLLLIGMVATAVMSSCGGSSDGSSNGALCEQCGDTDGPCQSSVVTTGDDRPSGCSGDPCTVELRCTRKVDSGQRRCFPVDPSTDQLDFRYECDGSRPIESFAPTITPSATPTLTPAATVSPTSTGPTATAATPTATGPTPTGPTPTVTATPAEAEDVPVTVVIEDPDLNDLPRTFSASVGYPTSKGMFLRGGVVDCEGDDGLTASDGGSGTLALAFSGDTDGISDVSITCQFHQVAGQTLTNADLTPAVNPASLTISIDDL